MSTTETSSTQSGLIAGRSLATPPANGLAGRRPIKTVGWRPGKRPDGVRAETAGRRTQGARPASN
ncbi:hypothetical protein [Propioniciclava tarda]|uniref:Uncharacterized protein n=1 Tax=Propioniciclava tarda TaxID=433330 RepID=A0A4Q9KJR8_PROTD|nr:hypothetical protein [Propioniciclava tarda]TBT94683.1 hypothetical protein ET996_09810 [Propioniciclava tarda]